MPNFEFNGLENNLPNPATALVKALEDPFGNGHAEVIAYFATNGTLERHAKEWGASEKKITELKEMLGKAQQKLAH